VVVREFKIALDEDHIADEVVAEAHSARMGGLRLRHGDGLATWSRFVDRYGLAQGVHPQRRSRPAGRRRSRSSWSRATGHACMPGFWPPDMFRHRVPGSRRHDRPTRSRSRRLQQAILERSWRVGDEPHTDTTEEKDQGAGMADPQRPLICRTLLVERRCGRSRDKLHWQSWLASRTDTRPGHLPH
jgi:hypothetical protein